MIFDKDSFRDFVLQTPHIIQRHRQSMFPSSVQNLTNEEIQEGNSLGSQPPLDIFSMSRGDAEAALMGQLLHWMIEAQIIPPVRLKGFWWNKVIPKRCLGCSGSPGFMDGIRDAAEVLALHSEEVLAFATTPALEAHLLRWSRVRTIGYQLHPQERPGYDAGEKEWLTFQEAVEKSGRTPRNLYYWYEEGLLETTREDTFTERLISSSSLKMALAIKKMRR